MYVTIARLPVCASPCHAKITHHRTLASKKEKRILVVQKGYMVSKEPSREFPGRPGHKCEKRVFRRALPVSEEPSRHLGIRVSGAQKLRC
jgi:hypothetical protein